MILKDGKAILREVNPEDFDGVTEVKHRSGLGRDFLENWHWLWAKNPAYCGSYPQPSMGWVVERGGTIVGYFGNIPQRFVWGGQELLAGTATALCVDPTFRGSGYGFDLVSAWSQQENVDVMLSTNEESREAQLTRTILGFGKHLSVLVVVKIADINRFTCAAHLNACTRVFSSINSPSERTHHGKIVRRSACCAGRRWRRLGPESGRTLI